MACAAETPFLFTVPLGFLTFAAHYFCCGQTMSQFLLHFFGCIFHCRLVGSIGLEQHGLCLLEAMLPLLCGTNHESISAA